MIPNFDVLGEMIRSIHTTLSHLFFIAMPVGILLSVSIGYVQNGTPDYIDILRRALVASILIVSFPEISNLILSICDGIALKIDNQSGFDTFLRLAEEKSRSYSGAKSALLLKFDDLIIALLSYVSFVILYIARYLTIALYYFFWVLLSALSPILIFFYLFPSTSGITKNLYKGLVEVASWKIVWSIQSAMLVSLSVGNIYKTEGSYLTLIVLNFVIALGMIFTPTIVKSLSGEGAHGMAHHLGTAAVSAAVGIPARTQVLKLKVQGVAQAATNSMTQKYQNFQKQRQEQQKRLRP